MSSARTRGQGEETVVGEMTLAFSLAALEELVDPAAVFADARGWSRYVGIVDNDTAAVESVVDAHGLETDFEAGDRDKWLALQEIRDSTGTARHVYVGRTDDDRRAAGHTGWEFLPVEEAATKADWTLVAEAGPLGRLRAWLRGRRP